MNHCDILKKASIFLFTWIFALLSAQAQQVFDLNTVHELRITFAQNDWDALLHANKLKNSDSRLVAKMLWDGVPYDSVGVRYKGNSSYYNVRGTGSTKLPFNLKINEIHKKQTLPEGVTTLKLSNVFRDPSFVREALSYEIARQYMAAPRCNFVRVFVNEKYVGLYNSSESLDDKFLSKKFEENSKILFKCDPDWKAQPIAGCPQGDKASLMYLGEDSTCYRPFYEQSSSKSAYKDLIRLTKILSQNPEKLEEILDIDATLWMLAFNNFTVNLDSYLGLFSHNYYLYKQTNGQFLPLIWDLNLCFGAFRLDGNAPTALNNEQMQHLSPTIHFQNPKRPLISQLLKNDFYKKIYIAHYRTILAEQSNENKLLKRAYQLQKMIENDVTKDVNKLYSAESFSKNMKETVEAGKNTTIIGIEELMNVRISYLQSHPLLQAAAPILSSQTANAENNQIKIQVQSTASSKVFLYFRNNKSDIFLRLEMTKSTDNQYVSTVEKKPFIQYYFAAENEKAATVFPEKAAREFFESKN